MKNNVQITFIWVTVKDLTNPVIYREVQGPRLTFYGIGLSMRRQRNTERLRVPTIKIMYNNDTRYSNDCYKILIFLTFVNYIRKEDHRDTKTIESDF